MKIKDTKIKDMKVLVPDVFSDNRGFFFESYNQKKFDALVGQNVNFVQDNHSASCQHVLRGLHYQINHPQGKLVRVISGEILDVAIDLRKNSPSFGQWETFLLSSENKQMLWIPEGFAHGFLVYSEHAEVLYKATDYYSPPDERAIIWNDPTLKIDWNLKPGIEPVISEKDLKGYLFSDAEFFP